MYKNSGFIVLALFAIAPISMAKAETGNDDNNFIGDRVSFPVLMKVKDGDNADICIAAATPLIGIGASADNSAVRFKANGDGTKCDGTTLPDASVIVVPLTSFKENVPSRYGLTYGVLAVPFKYHLSGAKDFSGAGTLGTYLGVSRKQREVLQRSARIHCIRWIGRCGRQSGRRW